LVPDERSGPMREWWLETRILSIPIWNWLSACVVAALVLMALLLIRQWVRRRAGQDAEHKRRVFTRMFFQIAASTSSFALLVLSILIGVKFLDMPPAWRAGMSQLWFVAVVLQVALWLNGRSEERRVGKECRSDWCAAHRHDMTTRGTCV